MASSYFGMHPNPDLPLAFHLISLITMSNTSMISSCPDTILAMILYRRLNGIALSNAVQVGVMDLQFSGRVRITLTGLMNRIPVVSAAQVCCAPACPHLLQLLRRSPPWDCELFRRSRNNVFQRGRC